MLCLLIFSPVVPRNSFPRSYYKQYASVIVCLFFVEDQLEELETGEDVAIIFRKGNFLQGYVDRQTFKKALKVIWRNDLARMLDIYVTAGK